MINNVAKLLKNVNSLHQAEIAARHTSHEKNEQIHCFGPLSRQEICFEKLTKKKQKIVFLRLIRARHEKYTENHAWCPEIKQVHRHANRARSNFSSKKTEKLVIERST